MDLTCAAAVLLLLSQGLEWDVHQAASVAAVLLSDLMVPWDGLQGSAEGQGDAARWWCLAERPARYTVTMFLRLQVGTRYLNSLTCRALRVWGHHVVISRVGNRGILLKE